MHSFQKKKSSSFDNFMTEKERNYIASIFKKNLSKSEKMYGYNKFYDIKQTRKHENKERNSERHMVELKTDDGTKNDINSCAIEKLSLERNECNDDTSNANAGNEFVKNTIKPAKSAKFNKISFIKSVKLPRLMIDVDVPVCDDLGTKLKIEEMIDAFMCLKYRIKDVDCNAVLRQNISELHVFFKVPKFQTLVKEIFEGKNEESKKILFLEMLAQCEHIKINDNISVLLDYLISFVPKLDVDEVHRTAFFNKFMFNVTGIIFATLLLINQESFALHFYKHIKTRMEYLMSNDSRYVWRFLALMLINLDDNDKKWIVGRLKDKIVEVLVSENEEDINNMNLFLEALGLSSENIT